MSIWVRLRPALKFAGWGVLFGLAYGQAPLFTSNQNQYFLHGLARIGQGFLAEDWLANTTDPTPVFTWLVALTARYLPQAAFYLYYLLLAGVYLFSLRRIADHLSGIEQSKTSRWVFLTLIFVTHSAGLRIVLGQGVGGDWQYLFDGGLAGQRLLGTVLQPSTFGVFLLLSVQQFIADRPYRAVVAAAIAAIVHPTYLLSAGVLSAAYILLELQAHREVRRALQIGGLSLLLVLPILIYSASSFLPSGAVAQGVLVHFRLPAHAEIGEWFGLASLTTLALIGVALALTRGTRLFLVMAISATVGGVLTVLQLLTGSDALALLFPWRVSTYLVPLSTAVLAAWFADWLSERLSGRYSLPILAASSAVIALSVLSGLVWMAAQSFERGILPERALFEYVRETRSSGQVYAVPSRLQDFRLATGAPILADFKSIPYKRGEVIQWHDRVRLLDWFYRDEIDCGLMSNFIEEYGVTHLVLGPEQLDQSCPEMQEQYNDGEYAVYQLEHGP